MTTIIIIAVLAAIGLFLVATYNRMIKARNLMEEGWSGIDVQLKKRYNLIPNLVSTVKGYATHERELLEEVTKYRSAGINAHTVKEQEQAENMLTRTLGKLFAVAENYPDLKANTNFLDLQNQLKVIEEDIQMARRYYNGTVRDNNILVESFPSNVVANLFGFKKGEYFEIDSLEREVPEVKF